MNNKPFWYLVLIFVSAAATFLLFTESGIQPVSETRGGRYAIMGYLLLLFSGVILGLMKLTLLQFRLPYITVIMFGIGGSLALTNLAGILILGDAWYQLLIGIATLVIGFWAGVRFTNFYMDSISMLEYQKKVD